MTCLSLFTTCRTITEPWNMLLKILETSEVFAYRNLFLGVQHLIQLEIISVEKRKQTKEIRAFQVLLDVATLFRNIFGRSNHCYCPFPYQVCFVANINMRNIADCVFGHMDNSGNDARGNAGIRTDNVLQPLYTLCPDTVRTSRMLHLLHSR